MKKMADAVTLKSGVVLKNRVVMAPMTTKMSFYDGVVTKDELEYYGLRSGEVGAVITAAANVNAGGKGWEGELSVESDEMHESLASLAATIKRDGTKAILQIFHAGRMTDDKVLRGVQPVSASNITAERPGAQEPRTLTNEEIIQIIADFKAATVRAIDAGFDGVELHGANTYLLQQFFSPHSNRRDDLWGGSLEKRYHFIDVLTDEVIKVVAEHAKRPFVVGYRFSPEEYEEPGIRFADTLYLVDKLAAKNLDYLHISLNEYNKKSVSPEYQDKTMLAYVEEKIAGRTLLIGVGSINTQKNVDETLANADIIAVGRAILLDPHWTNKILTNREAEIRTILAIEDAKELKISNGVLGFLNMRMAEKIK